MFSKSKISILLKEIFFRYFSSSINFNLFILLLVSKQITLSFFSISNFITQDPKHPQPPVTKTIFI